MVGEKIGAEEIPSRRMSTSFNLDWRSILPDNLIHARNELSIERPFSLPDSRMPLRMPFRHISNSRLLDLQDSRVDVLTREEISAVEAITE